MMDSSASGAGQEVIPLRLLGFVLLLDHLKTLDHLFRRGTHGGLLVPTFLNGCCKIRRTSSWNRAAFATGSLDDDLEVQDEFRKFSVWSFVTATKDTCGHLPEDDAC